MERYSEYKDSGVQWLGEIPGHWRCIQNRFIFKENVRTPQEDDIPLSLSQVDGLIPTDDMKESSLKTSSYDNWKRVHIDDIVLNRFKAHLGVLFASKYIGMVSFHYGVFERTRPIIPKYYEYMFHSDQFRLILGFASKGMTVGLQNLGNADFYNLKSLYPPIDEQKGIVSYLDDKCGKIDKMVEGKQKQIELLAEMKQRIVADAVTKGLNPNAKMKATNILWLPEIPENWKMSKVSSHFKQRNEKVSDKDYPALSVSKQGVTPQLANVALSNAEGCSRKLVKVGDYAVNSRSDRKGSCGVSKYEGSVSLITIVLEPFNIDGDYVHHLFRSNPWVEEFYRNGRGIVADLWTTNYQMMKSMYMPIPPIEEQHEIVSFVNKKVAKIEALISKLQKEIELIKEYKQRLISDVVTGQIKVC